MTGGRAYANAVAVARVLDVLPPGAVLVHGAAPGLDRLAAAEWERRGGAVEPHPARWGRYGPAAGPIRNQEMVSAGVDVAVRFPGGAGTADCAERAARAGVPVFDAGDLGAVRRFLSAP